MTTDEAIEILGGLVSRAGGEGDDALDIIKDAIGGEFRRGYLHGKREMLLSVENALSGLRVEEN